MALSDFLAQSATITAEAAAGATPPQTRSGGADRSARLTVADGVPCLVRPLGASLAAFATARDQARRNVVSARIYFAADPAPEGLSTRHWIDVDGRTYKVTGVVDYNSLHRLFAADCEMIR